MSAVSLFEAAHMMRLILALSDPVFMLQFDIRFTG